jgi:hypothetical protein
MDIQTKNKVMETTNEKIKLVVLEENTLGYILPELPNYVSILHTSTLRGSYYNGMGSSIYLGNKPIRLASEKDFDNFRVCFDGYKKRPQEYEFEM